MCKRLLLVASLLLATAAFAVDAAYVVTKGSITLTEPVTVTGKQLPAGDYTVTWKGAGPTVEVKILKNKDVVATLSARVVGAKEDNKGVSVKRNSDGTSSIVEINLGGKKPAVVIE